MTSGGRAISVPVTMCCSSTTHARTSLNGIHGRYRTKMKSKATRINLLNEWTMKVLSRFISALSCDAVEPLHADRLHLGQVLEVDQLQ